MKHEPSSPSAPPVFRQAATDKFVFLVRTADGRQIWRWQSKPTVAHQVVARGQTSYSQGVAVALPELLPNFTSVTIVATGR